MALLLSKMNQGTQYRVLAMQPTERVIAVGVTHTAGFERGEAQLTG